MKTLIFTLLISLSLFIGKVSTAKTLNETTATPTIYPVSASIIDVLNSVSEENLDIKPWMTDDHYWDYNSEDLFHVENEKPLEVEDWMTDSEQWKNKKTASNKVSFFETDDGAVYVFRIKQVKEQALQVEKWMIDDNYWN